MDTAQQGNARGSGPLLCPESEFAEREMLADVIRDALLTRYAGTVRPVHRIWARQKSTPHGLLRVRGFTVRRGAHGWGGGTSPAG